LHFRKFCQIYKLRKLQVDKRRRVSKLEDKHVHKFGQVRKPNWIFSESLNCRDLALKQYSNQRRYVKRYHSQL